MEPRRRQAPGCVIVLGRQEKSTAHVNYSNAPINADRLRHGPYRFYFYSHEPNEPPHIHVDRDELSAKFWVGPVGLARNLGFRARELAEIERIVHDNEKRIIEAWHEYFGT